MIRIEHEVVVRRPLAEVFAYVSDPMRTPEWQASVIETRRESGEPFGAGSRWREVRQFLGRRLEATVAAEVYEPEREFSVRAESGPVPFRVRHLFEEVDGGTRISVVAEGEPGRLARLGAPLVARAAETQLRQDFARLREVLER